MNQTRIRKKGGPLISREKGYELWRFYTGKVRRQAIEIIYVCQAESYVPGAF
jgi:hypothetical protein